MAALTKGDKVIVNYSHHGHKVVNCICTVIKSGLHDYYLITAPTKAQGAAANCEYWSLKLGPNMQRYYEPVKVGDTVYITGYMDSYSGHEEDPLPDERGEEGIITFVGMQGHRYRIGKWWYPRESFSTNKEALLEPDWNGPEEVLPHAVNPAPYVPAPLAKKPTIKYKLINRKSESDNDFVSF